VAENAAAAAVRAAVTGVDGEPMASIALLYTAPVPNRAPTLITLLLAFALAAVGCGGVERQLVDTASMTAMLETAMPLLAQAYADGNVEVLRPYAAERELARITNLIGDLARSGRHLVPTFHHLTVEDSRTWNNSSAYMTTVEVWDIRLYALGRDDLLAEEIGKSQRVKYQMMRDGDSWRILYRAIEQ